MQLFNFINCFTILLIFSMFKIFEAQNTLKYFLLMLLFISRRVISLGLMPWSPTSIVENWKKKNVCLINGTLNNIFLCGVGIDTIFGNYTADAVLWHCIISSTCLIPFPSGKQSFPRQLCQSSVLLFNRKLPRQSFFLT